MDLATMELTHHHRLDDSHPLGWRWDPDRVYPQKPTPQSKPQGLWLSVDGDWHRWSDEEGMGWTDPEHSTEVRFELTDPYRVFHIATGAELDKLTAALLSGEKYSMRMNWAALADSRWGGIVIAPYLWDRRLQDGSSWYYGWDCASACIWDLSVVRCIGAVHPSPEAS